MKDAQESKTFDHFGFKPTLLKAIKDIGFVNPSPIQEQVIPHILRGSDVIAQAQTGTGKTAAFALPSIEMMGPEHRVQLLVITPTRELSQQVSDEISRYSSSSGIKTTTVYGGQSISRQIEAIRKGVQVVVATPGRLLDLLQSKRLRYFEPSIVVLDEADEMLDMGFLDDIKAIFTYLPETRQTLLFSATMPDPIRSLANKILKSPISVKITKSETTNQDIEQQYYVIRDDERDDALIRLIDSHDPLKSIVFCKTKKEVDRLATLLVKKGHAAKGLHGDMEQNQRQNVIQAFRHGDIRFLIATDVAARGLNVIDVTHVFNYHMPYEVEGYVHRIGRTGRAGRKGVAMTLLTMGESRALQRMLKSHGTQMNLCAVPSLKEVKKLHALKFLDLVRNQSSHDGAIEVLKKLQENMDIQQISLNLIALLLERQTVSGAEQIGVAHHELDQVASRMKHGDKELGDRDKRRRRRPGFGFKQGQGPGRKPQRRGGEAGAQRREASKAELFE